MAHPLAEIQDTFEGAPSLTSEERERIRKYHLPGDCRGWRKDIYYNNNPKVRAWYKAHEAKLKSFERLGGL